MELNFVSVYKDYLDLVRETTEAPDIFHFANFSIVLGQITGRKKYVVCSERIFPNFFICHVGESGLARKTAGWSKAKKIILLVFQDIIDRDDHKISIVTEATAEAIFSRLDGENKSMIFNPGEFRSFIEKAKQKSTNNLIPKITELYDHGDFIEKITVTRGAHKPKNWFFQFVTMTDINWLSSLSRNDMIGGFGNRFMFACGKPDRVISRPPEMDESKLSKLVDKLKELRQDIEEQYQRNGNESMEVKLDHKADLLFDDYYKNCFYPMASKLNLGNSMLKRQTDYILRMALLNAVIQKKQVISEEELAIAIHNAKVFGEATMKVFADFDKSERYKEEDRILQHIQENYQQDKKMTMREVYHPLHMEREKCYKILQSLEKAGDIKLRKSGNSVIIER